MSGPLKVRALVPGDCQASALVLDAPLSFWGGMDPDTGRIIDRQHPQRGEEITDRVLVLPGIRGSTAAPGGLLECLAAGTGPAALLTTRFEVVPLVTALTGELLDLSPPAVAVLDHGEDLARMVTGMTVVIDGDHWRLGEG